MNKITVIGIGPGACEQMTLQAVQALKESDVIIGYTVYTELVKQSFPDKRYLTTPMRQEEKRCEMAFEEAEKGISVAFVCSGDAGVYGMAGLLYELSEKYPDTRIHVVPGITAALSGAAVLGAPLSHDFAVISLSDLLTPLAMIEKRVRCAAEADFIICLYNPSSKMRSGYLRLACDWILEKASPDTVCGTVKNIGREGECREIMTLKQLREYKADMFTTVFIGNSNTRKIGNHMVTPRGYLI